MSTGISSSVVAAARGSKDPAPAGRQLGTLVVVVLKAKNLPNKQKIGKQDPYCSCTIGHQKHRTPANKRGGQTPFWDTQLQFEIWEDAENAVRAVTTGTGGIAGAPLTPNTKGKGRESSLPTDDNGTPTVGRQAKSSNGKDVEGAKRLLKLACYADDPREPELIGETTIDFSGTLKKGEFDEWVEIKHRGKYAGEVFLEMTFYASGPPPVRRQKTKPADLASGYGGPGTFEPLPTSFPQSPVQGSPMGTARVTRERDRLPAALSPGGLSPSPAQSLRASQSSLALRASQASHASGVSEFGARQPSPNLAFPAAPHRQTSLNDSLTENRYTPPYAPQSLAQSTSVNDLRPHRYSTSSFGLTPHDIDSLSRPFSSMSVGSTNKPLPLPTPGSQGEGGQIIGLHRPPSAQAPFDPNLHAPPLEHHSHSMPDPRMPSPGPPQQHYQHNPHPSHAHDQARPGHGHRHSVATYIPQATEPAYSNWNGGTIPVEPLDANHSHQQHLGEPFRSTSATSWHDPRGPSPVNAPYQAEYPPQSPHSQYAPAASQSLSPHFGHQSSLTPPSSHQPQFASHSPEPMAHSQYGSLGRASPSFVDPHRHSPQQPPNDWRAPSPNHQAMPPPPPQNAWDQAAHFHQQQQQHNPDPYGGTVNHPQLPYEAGPPPNQYPQHSHQPSYHSSHSEYRLQDSHNQNPQGDSGYHASAPPSHPYQPDTGYPVPHAPNSAAHQNLQTDYRTASPYRPLPSTPDPWQQQQQQHPLPHQQYQQAPPLPAQDGYHSPVPPQHAYNQPYQPSTTPTPPQTGAYQPRFGLPPHQPYDPPYNPSRYHPPPVPPVPDQLRREQTGGWS